MFFGSISHSRSLKLENLLLLDSGVTTPSVHVSTGLDWSARGVWVARATYETSLTFPLLPPQAC